jgi:hypothetical protein
VEYNRADDPADHFFPAGKTLFEYIQTRQHQIVAESAIRFHDAFPDLVDEIFGDGQSSRRYSVGNIAFTVATRTFGYSTESQKTVESRIWRPIKPVAHAAAAFFLCLGSIKNPEQEWDDEHKLCLQQPFLATLFYEDVFRSLLLSRAEGLRFQVSNCERFHIG